MIHSLSKLTRWGIFQGEKYHFHVKNIIFRCHLYVMKQTRRKVCSGGLVLIQTEDFGLFPYQWWWVVHGRDKPGSHRVG